MAPGCCEVVRDAAGQGADRLHLLGLTQLCSSASLSICACFCEVTSWRTHQPDRLPIESRKHRPRASSQYQFRPHDGRDIRIRARVRPWKCSRSRSSNRARRPMNEDFCAPFSPRVDGTVGSCRPDLHLGERNSRSVVRSQSNASSLLPSRGHSAPRFPAAPVRWPPHAVVAKQRRNGQRAEERDERAHTTRIVSSRQGEVPPRLAGDRDP